MKVLYVDPICYKAHAYYNKRNVEILSKLCDLSVLFTDDYFSYDGLKIDKVYSYSTPIGYFIEYNKYKSYLLRGVKNKIGQFKIMREIMRLIKKQTFDLVIFSGVDMVVFNSLTKKTKQNIAFVDHGIYRTCTNKFIRNKWQELNPQLKVCVFEPFIEDYLKESLQIKNDIFIIHHPISRDSINIECKSLASDKIRIFAPSHSNSLEFERELLDNKDAITSNVDICLKGSTNITVGSVRIYSDFLTREEYIDYFEKADYILIPYDKNYMYRVSGVLFDSLAHKKKIMLMGGNTLKCYSERYPNLFNIYNDANDFINRVNALTRDDINSEYSDSFFCDLKIYLKDYSDDNIRKDFERLLRAVKYDNN